jgi:flagellar M-ring protein FliF
MANGTQLEKSNAARTGQPQVLDRLSGGWSRAQQIWVGMQPDQRRRIVTVSLMLTALTAGVLWYMLRTDWRTLYANMDTEDVKETGLVLTQAQIPFETTADGTGIRVPAAQLNKARLATASKGSVKSGRLGFELFDKANWAGSEFDEQVNYQRALEGELEQTIGTISDVASARVHLVMTHDSLFKDQERPAKASVVLKLRHGSLADGEPEAIRNLVASAVDGLSADRVVLVDAAGRLPLGTRSTEGMRLSAEQALEEKLVSTLEPVTGVGNVRASVTLDYDASATEETKESYDPNQTVTLSMQRTEQTSGAQTVAAGVPGTASNAPNSQSTPVYPKQTSSPQSSKSESGTYATTKTVVHTTEAPGSVRRMTAAIIVNDRLIQTAAHGKAAQWQARSATELQNLTALAQAAVGFEASRGDALTVQDMAFDENRAEQPVSTASQFLHTAESSPVLVKYVALLIAVTVILAFGVRPALKKVRSLPAPKQLPAGPKKGAAGELSAAEQQALMKPPEPAEADPERMRAQQIFEQVSEHLKREPTQSSRLLQSWIHTE